MIKITEDKSKKFPVTILLNELQFGIGGCDYISSINFGYTFYHELSDNKFNYITFSYFEEPILIAVTKEQFKSWNSYKLFAYKCKIEESSK